MTKPISNEGGTDLRERATEIASSVAITELWCEAAQIVIYDLRDEIERLEKQLEQMRPILRALSS